MRVVILHNLHNDAKLHIYIYYIYPIATKTNKTYTTFFKSYTKHTQNAITKNEKRKNENEKRKMKNPDKRWPTPAFLHKGGSTLCTTKLNKYRNSNIINIMWHFGLSDWSKCLIMSLLSPLLPIPKSPIYSCSFVLFLHIWLYPAGCGLFLVLYRSNLMQ